jgi:DNA-directed RNA polymerase beta subunit
VKRVEEHEQRVKDDYDKIGGKALLVPGSASVSGARKLLASVQRDATLCIMTPEVPIVQTGYENRFGEYSSSIAKAETDYQVVAKISKFSFSPNHHYWLICKDLHSNMVTVIERVSAHHVTEQYGYLYNNTYLDSINKNDIISANTTMKTSLAYDEFGNRMDGVNLNVLYMALDDNMEDSVVISDEAAKKFVAPLVKTVTIMINENDIPLNYYGNNDIYKCMPDIGEHTKNAILLALRKENKDNAIFAQSVERLKMVEMNDDKYLLNGTVVDVNIYCNNPENLDTYYNGQFKLYYLERQRCAREFISVLTPIVASGCVLSDELKDLYGLAKRIANGSKHIEKREFSNMEIELTVLEERELQVGDKISNRYGGKGVISEILPQSIMPKTEDGEYADIIMNSSTMYNRVA